MAKQTRPLNQGKVPSGPNVILIALSAVAVGILLGLAGHSWLGQ